MAIRSTRADAAIDLGIALESLFLNDQADERGELSFRLRVRAARYLGADLSERRRVFQFVGDLYSVRSTAAHTGTVPQRVRNLAIGDLLQEGFTVTAHALTRFITEDEPDWNLVTLS